MPKMKAKVGDQATEPFPINTLSERLESIRIVHTMAVIGAKVEKERMAQESVALSERLGALQNSIRNDLGHSVEKMDTDLSMEEIVNELERNETFILKLDEVSENSRRNYAISMVAAFESFLSEMLSMTFHRCPLSMKNGASTLTDDVLVEAIIADDVLDVLVSTRVRKVMSQHLMKCGEVIGNLLGIDTKRINELKELVLVRNCLVHNDCRPSLELIAAFPEYGTEKRIVPDGSWLDGNHKRLFEISNDLWVSINEKIMGPPSGLVHSS